MFAFIYRIVLGTIWVTDENMLIIPASGIFSSEDMSHRGIRSPWGREEKPQGYSLHARPIDVLDIVHG